MVFRSIDGTPLREARVGEQLEFYLALQPDSELHSAYYDILLAVIASKVKDFIFIW